MAAVIGCGVAGSTSAAELTGTVIRWEKDFGALHVRTEDGREVVVPVMAQTEVVADYGDVVSGNLFEVGERVLVTRNDDGPLRVEVRPPSEEDEEVAVEIRDEMETSHDPKVTESPIPVASVTPDSTPEKTPDSTPLTIGVEN